MRHLIGRAASAAALLVIASLPARAQDPVKLPGVKVEATKDLPGPKLLVGIVVDTAGNVIPGAEVTIPGIARRLFSASDGTFRFDSVPRGKYSMRARKIGFAPQVREFRVDAEGGVAEFQLLPITHALPPVVSSASRRGLSGVVGDLSQQTIPGATVRVLANGMHTTTDASGFFYLPVPAGSYMVSIAKDSFTTRLVSVRIPPDSGRNIEAWLQPGGPVPRGEHWNIDDLRERQAWIKKENRVLYTHEELLKLKIEWIADAVAMTAMKFNQVEAYDRDCMVLVNGGPSMANLETLTIDDVESVEVYPGFPGTSATVAAAAPMSKRSKGRGGAFVAVDNARHARIENGPRHCPGVFVWMR